MNITIIQPDIIWENKKENIKQYTKIISNNTDNKDIIILPEMFTTGFTMEPKKFAEKMGGISTKWMIKMAETHDCAIVGSLIIEENGNYYNRLFFTQPNGIVDYYDKKHLFAFAGENNNYTPGNRKNIVDYNGWRINLMVCYDLRFPVWSRNQNDYDMIIYVANWPEQRNTAWKSLLQARSIENQCYVVGVNRVGKDGKNNNYSGDSSVFDPLGELVWRESNKVSYHTIKLDKNKVNETREQFPFYLDADKFKIY